MAPLLTPASVCEALLVVVAATMVVYRGSDGGTTTSISGTKLEGMMLTGGPPDYRKP